MVERTVSASDINLTPIHQNFFNATASNLKKQKEATLDLSNKSADQ